MSVAVNQYVVYGFSLSFDEMRRVLDGIFDSEDQREQFEDEYHDNGYREAITRADKLALIMDGMNGEYAYLGVILEKAECGHMVESFTPARLKCPAKDKRALMALLLAQKLALFQKPTIHLVTHYH